MEEATETEQSRTGQKTAVEDAVVGDPKRMHTSNDDNGGGGGADHEDMDEDDWGDDISYLDSYRQDWERLYGKLGSFEDETEIPNMVLTDGPELPLTTCPMDLLQIFSVKVMEIKEALQWPLDVYGHVAVRDSLDHKRIYLFRRKREDCQALASPQDSSLKLTGPSRAIALIDPVIFEVDLKVKSKGSPFECDDKVLSYHAFCYHNVIYRHDTGFARKQVESTEHSTMEFMFAHLKQAVEATIQIRVDEGSSNLKARVAAVTAGIDEEVVLLDSLDRKVVVDGHGLVTFQRNVVVVDEKGMLIVSVEATEGDGGDIITKKMNFRPRVALRSKALFKFGFCNLSVVVAWSMVP